MGLSAYSNASLEDVITQADGRSNPYAMQISLLKNRGLTIQLLERAESTWNLRGLDQRVYAGVLTVDRG